MKVIPSNNTHLYCSTSYSLACFNQHWPLQIQRGLPIKSKIRFKPSLLSILCCLLVLSVIHSRYAIANNCQAIIDKSSALELTVAEIHSFNKALDDLAKQRWPKLEKLSPILSKEFTSSYQNVAGLECANEKKLLKGAQVNYRTHLSTLRTQRDSFPDKSQFANLLRVYDLFESDTRPKEAFDIALALITAPPESAALSVDIDLIEAIWENTLEAITPYNLNPDPQLVEQAGVFYGLRSRAMRDKGVYTRTSYKLSKQALLTPLNLELQYFAAQIFYLKDQGIKAFTTPETATDIFLKVLQLIIALTLTLFVCHRTPYYLAKMQRAIYRSPALQKSRTKTLSLIATRFLKPNAPWLLALLIIFTFDAISIFGKLYTAGILTYAIAYIARIFPEWVVDRSYDRSRIITSISLSDSITKQARELALSIAVVFVSQSVLFLVLKVSFILAILIPIVGAFTWLRIILFLSPHDKAARKLVQIHFSIYLSKPLTPMLERKRFRLLYPITILVVTFFDLILVFHNYLLRFEPYQKLSAHWFRLRLDLTAEEGQEDDDPHTDTAYDRWFTDTPPVALDKVRVKSSLFTQTTDLLTRWLEKSNEDNALLITADRGMGRSTLLKQLTEEWTECKITSICLDKRLLTASEFFALLSENLNSAIANEEELLTYDAASQKQIIIIDNLNRAFLSEVGHFDAIKTIIDCTSSSTRNIFWILAASTPSWHYLSHVLGRSHYIYTHLTIPRWSMQEIKQLIMSRHEASKRKLVYNEQLLSAAAEYQFDSMRAAETRFFHLLWQQSQGNPAVALNLWCSAITTKQRFVIQVGVPSRPNIEKLSDLADDQLFVLKSVVKHGVITISECIQATHLPESVVRRALKVSTDMGCVSLTDGLYSIKTSWYYPITNFLYQRNILHG